MVARDLSACLPLGLLLSRTVLTPKLARGEVVALTPHTPSFHRKFADTDASSSAEPAPISAIYIYIDIDINTNTNIMEEREH
jgi:hypothetical protein